MSYVEFSFPYESQIQDIQRLFKEIRKLSDILVHRLMNLTQIVVSTHYIEYKFSCYYYLKVYGICIQNS